MYLLVLARVEVERKSLALGNCWSLWRFDPALMSKLVNQVDHFVYVPVPVSHAY